jgi:hypothetical protein
MPTIDIMTKDLFFRAKIEETARAVGAAKPRYVSSPDQVQADLVLLELGPRTGGAETVGQIIASAPRARIVAFGSHIDTETLARAKVMARSRFVQELPRILSSGVAGPPS